MFDAECQSLRSQTEEQSAPLFQLARPRECTQSRCCVFGIFRTTGRPHSVVQAVLERITSANARRKLPFTAERSLRGWRLGHRPKSRHVRGRFEDALSRSRLTEDGYVKRHKNRTRGRQKQRLLSWCARSLALPAFLLLRRLHAFAGSYRASERMFAPLFCPSPSPPVDSRCGGSSTGLVISRTGRSLARWCPTRGCQRAMYRRPGALFKDVGFPWRSAGPGRFGNGLATHNGSSAS